MTMSRKEGSEPGGLGLGLDSQPLPHQFDVPLSRS
jgi:hypothetical protein